MKPVALLVLLGLGACAGSGVTTTCGASHICMDAYRDAKGGMLSPVVTGHVFYDDREPNKVIEAGGEAVPAPAVSLIGSATSAVGLIGAASALKIDPTLKATIHP